MTRQLIRYNAIRRADLLDDQLAPADIVSREASAITQEDLQEGVLSQIKRIVRGESAGDWSSEILPSSDLTSLATRIQTIESLKRLRRVQVVNAVAVPGGQSFKVLSAIGGETPSRPVAISGTTEGAVVAQLGPGELGAASTLSVAGRPEKNLCIIREAVTDDQIFAFGQEIFGLLQVESTATDGSPFDDQVDGNRGQLTFVYRDPATGLLQVVPASDIGGKTIEYAFADRIAMIALPEEAFVAEPLFADQGAAVDVTRQNAYLGGNVLQVSVAEGNWLTALADGAEAAFLDPTQTRKILAVRALGAGDEVELNAEVLDINNTQPADFQQGIAVDTADGRINLGVTTGKVDRPVGDLEVEASTGSLTLDGAGGELSLGDSRVASPLPLSDPANTALPGGATSILGGIAYAASQGGADLGVGIRENTGGTIPAGGNVPGGGFFDFTAPGAVFFDESTPSTRNIFVFMNGVLLRSGDAVTPNDVRPGTNPAQGDMIFTFPVKNGDVFLAMSLIQ